MEVRLKIKNFEAQNKVFHSKTRYRIVAKGRRFGLTKGAANWFIEGALGRHYKKGLWVDTIHSNIDRYVERMFIPELKKLPKDMWKWQKQQKTLYILDSYIDFRSADKPENMEGFGYDRAFLNEAGIILSNEYLWRNAIQPMLIEYKCPAVIGGNPKGKGLFHELYLKGLDPDNTDYEAFHYTSFDNPYLDPKEIQKMIDDAPEHVAMQEYYGHFLDDSGTVFRGLSDVLIAVPQKPVPGRIYTMGVDLAKVQDYTVIAVYDRHTLQQVYQDRFKDLDWTMQRKRIKAISHLYNRAPVVIDATGVGDPIADDLMSEGVPILPVKFTNESKKIMVEKLSLWIQQRRIRMLDIKETREEFTNFTYEVLPSGRIRYNAPAGVHDDIVMAHALAVKDLYYVENKKPEEKSRIRLELEKRATNTGQSEDIDGDLVIIPY